MTIYRFKFIVGCPLIALYNTAQYMKCEAEGHVTADDCSNSTLNIYCRKSPYIVALSFGN